MINATGDQFFLPDSHRFHFDALKGPKYIRSVPNADHSLDDTDAFKMAADASMNSAATFAVHNVGSTLEYRCEMVALMVFGQRQQEVIIDAGLVQGW